VRRFVVQPPSAMEQNSRGVVQAFFRGGTAARVGLWLGKPHADTEVLYRHHYGVKDFEGVRQLLGDDCRWVMADEYYRHPRGAPMFDTYGGREKASHGQQGVFADAESIADVEGYAWPEPQHMDVEGLLQELLHKRSFMRFSGCWSPFFHQVADFFGMENYFIKMHTQPQIVEAVTDHVVSAYLAINERIFTACRGEIDAFFFGNDFGSQLDLMISPEMFDRFVMPYLKKLIDQAKRFDLPVMLHSCGAIDRVIPRLIDGGIDALHPLQAKARGMDAENLARKYRGQITFVGGVDTQELLVHGTPHEVRREVQRLKDLWGPRFVVSPSHEALLPNVPPENCQALAEAALERKL